MLFKMDSQNLHVCVIIMEQNDIFESTERAKEAALPFDCSYFWNTKASCHIKNNNYDIKTVYAQHNCALHKS